MGLLVYLLRIRHLPAINQVLCLTIACVLLPPTSFDYTLLHLYTPWALCVLFAVDTYRARRLRIPGLAAVFVCFAILFAQLGEFVLHGDRLGGQIRATVLLVLFLVALRYPLQTASQPSDTSVASSF